MAQAERSPRGQLSIPLECALNICKAPKSLILQILVFQETETSVLHRSEYHSSINPAVRMNVGATSPYLTRLIVNRVLCSAPEKFEGFCSVQDEAV
jgi:hypothetical protein